MTEPYESPKEVYYGVKLLELLRGASWPEVHRRLSFYLSDFFYRENILKTFLFERDFSDLPHTEFIDYPCYLNYYRTEAKQVRAKIGATEKTLILPYKEEINFIENPKTEIRVLGDITEYSMLESIKHETEGNLDAYLKKQLQQQFPVIFGKFIIKINTYLKTL